MLSEYEAAMLAKQKATGGEPALGYTAPARNRMGAVLARVERALGGRLAVRSLFRSQSCRARNASRAGADNP